MIFTMMTQDKATRIATKVVFCLFAITIIFILISICFFNSMPYRNKREWFPNILVILLTVPTIMLISTSSIRYPEILKNKWWKFLLLIALTVFQILCVYRYYFHTGWDVYGIITVSTALAHGEAMPEALLPYYSYYPNNLFLTSIFVSIIRITNAIFPQTRGTEGEYFALLIVQCLLNQATGAMIYCLAKKLCKREKYAWIAYTFYILLIGLSPWVSIPYSDSMALIFPVAILALYMKQTEGKKTIFKWLGIAALAYLGYSLKPQTVVIAIAIAIMELFSLPLWIRTRNEPDKTNIRNAFLKALAGICLGVLLGLGIVQGFIHLTLPFKVYSEKRLGIAHSLMMGMNPENGTWDQEDIEFSRSFETNKERDAADLQRAGERIKNMGFTGFLNQMTRKALINFNNGTFAWEKEGDFYKTTREEPNDSLTILLKDTYYRDGKYQTLWMHTAQAAWLCVLTLSLLAVFTPKTKPTAILMLTAFGLTLFLLLFEARARYVYTNVPILILLAAQGLQTKLPKLPSLPRIHSKQSN